MTKASVENVQPTTVARSYRSQISPIQASSGARNAIAKRPAAASRNLYGLRRRTSAATPFLRTLRTRMNPASPHLLPLLKQYFGFTAFRPLQQEIMRDTLTGRDVFPETTPMAMLVAHASAPPSPPSQLIGAGTVSGALLGGALWRYRHWISIPLR